MANDLPNPESRKEAYLAKAAGMDVEIPEQPESRLEQYLEAIAEGGGGGGTSYTAGDGIDITDNTISATNTGESKVLTSDDFNWNYETGTTESPNAVALWLLPSGLYGYNGDFNLPVYLTPYQNWTGTGALFLVSPLKEDINCVTISAFLINGSDIPQYTVSLTDGSIYGQNVFPSNNGVISIISSYIQTGYGAPSNTDYGTLGKMYVDTSTGTIYYCSDIDTSDPEQYLYTWSVLSGGGSAYTELTTADYNWPTSNPDGIAIWLLSDGMYRNSTGSNIKMYMSTHNTNQLGNNRSFIKMSQNGEPYTIYNTNEYNQMQYYLGRTDGSLSVTYTVLTRDQIEDSLNYTGTSQRKALDACQGKALKDLIDSLVIKNAGAPTTATVGTVGMLYEDTTNGKLYQCTAIDTTDPQNPSYTWSEIGGGGVTPVQTTGTSTTDVMSQNAVTSMVYASGYDPTSSSSDIRIALGKYGYMGGKDSFLVGYSNGTRSFSDYTINIMGSYAVGIGDITIGYSANTRTGSSGNTIIGYHAGAGEYAKDNVIIGSQGGINSNTSYSVALGSYSKPLSSGEVNIGLTSIGAGHGYNNSNYRLISGVYDGQGLHDAATVAQGNTLATSAPTTTTEGVLGQLYTDTTNMHTYQCTAIDTTDPDNPSYTWTQRW